MEKFFKLILHLRGATKSPWPSHGRRKRYTTSLSRQFSKTIFASSALLRAVSIKNRELIEKLKDTICNLIFQ